MSLTIPAYRDINVSEKRTYTITYDFCGLGTAPTTYGLFATAYPRFAYPAVDVAFFDFSSGSPATKPTRRFFSTGDALWKVTGERSGPPTQDRPLGGQYNVWTAAPEVQMPVSLSGRVITVTIPFGASFTRLINPDGSVSSSDANESNDPIFYYYGVGTGGSQIGGGSINVTIDLSVVTPLTPVADPTLCSVEVA